MVEVGEVVVGVGVGVVVGVEVEIMKYRNTLTECRVGIVHHSKLEAGRCNELHILKATGQISQLRAHPQPSYRLEVNGHLICKVRPDFEYVNRDGVLITEDAKGMMTGVAKLKYALFEAIYGRPIHLVRR